MRIALILAAASIATAFYAGKTPKNVTIKNTLDLDREAETISIPVSSLQPRINLKQGIVVKDETGKILVSQLTDLDGDTQPDALLFQISIKANAQKTVVIENSDKKPIAGATTYARFVPERIDDFAWENDKVAFRRYGPTAQRMVEDRKPGGTLSSGMDCWLKRVNHPVIDKWYKQNTEGKSYHKDHGEGYDPYHVNASRGCGGLGVWQNDSLFVSKNFTHYKIIASGPIRTIFELTYAPWQADGITIKETKRISLDLGSQLSRYEVTLETSAPLPNCTVGVTLHDKKGKTFTHVAGGWCSYWETIDDSELGTGVVVEKQYLENIIDYRTAKKDLSQLYAVAHPKENKVIYYAGYGWKKAGQFTTPESWNQYLSDFSKKIQSPLEVTVK